MCSKFSLFLEHHGRLEACYEHYLKTGRQGRRSLVATSESVCAYSSEQIITAEWRLNSECLLRLHSAVQVDKCICEQGTVFETIVRARSPENWM
jgi:hypothetical protein